MPATSKVLECPFCAYTDKEAYMLMLHVEERHTDDSPFVIREGPDAAAQLTPAPGHRRSSSPQQKAPSDNDIDDDRWMLCPDPECGEQIQIEDLNEHLDLHYAEGLLESQRDKETGHSNAASPSTASQPSKQSNGRMRQNTPSIASKHSFSVADDSFFSDGRPDEGRRRRHHRGSHYQNGHSKATSQSGSDKSTISRTIRDVLIPSGGRKLKAKDPGPRSARLGKSELGPYAFEERMPSSLYRQIEAGPKVSIVNRIGRDGRLIKHEVVDNETPGILPVLAQLCAIDKDVKQAYFCHPSTMHICKRPREGGFCGYRNIQMMVSYMQGAKAQGHAQFPPRTPGILILQDLIEQAWDMGINEVSRIQTGGIKGTRKYIGTPEVQALLRSLRIDHGLQIFSDHPDHGPANEQLLNYVHSYFEEGTTQGQREKRPKIVKTHLPPIYLQQPGHSITIVGCELHKDGSRNLLVFDPMFHTSPGMSKILGRRDLRTPRPEVLQAYRRGDRQLKRHRDYELISLAAHPPLFPAWDVLEKFVDHSYVYAFFVLPSLGYDIIPEEDFPLVFPWWDYGGLFCTDDARFACNPSHITHLANDDDFHTENIDIGTDTGLLGGMPPLHDREFMKWIGLFDKVKRSISPGGFGKDGRERVNAALQGSKDSSNGLLFHQPLPEDVYFEKTVGPAVPIHYACGSSISRGFQHHAFKRCGPEWPHSRSDSSSGPSVISPVSSMSPEFDQATRQPFRLYWQAKQSFRTSLGSVSELSDLGGCRFMRTHCRSQERNRDVISPRSSLATNMVCSHGLPQESCTHTHNRRDSGLGILDVPSFTAPFGTTASNRISASSVISPEECCTTSSPQRSEQNRNKPFAPHARFSRPTRSVTHLLNHQSSGNNSNETPSSPKSPLAPPVLDLGSIDLFSSSITSHPSLFPLESSHHNHPFAVSNRTPTPVHELRDFFFERDAEGEQTPVFYATGGNDVSRGWRAKMGAEW